DYYCGAWDNNLNTGLF
nr:immunoglobulin light chain junction region [Macaca mulatta]MOW27510.1 immunoglobulin light chain junction region [Macaca mulatta]MOW27729.1 immunoglobulin light chain junction region [Macaca mulatta]MOW28174.1 immunoglobulin light chain junction region [Macaca mulatta]MOW28322.1 immunoglobulin light chain junction region [Macaca mulatta]